MIHCFVLVQVFLAEKRFEGCGGLEITDEIKVTIAAQACMLLLNRKPTYFPKLRTILVYPATYVAQTTSSDGTFVVEDRSVRLGESWQSGPVVLAWDSVKGGTSNTVGPVLRLRAMMAACGICSHRRMAKSSFLEDGMVESAFGVPQGGKRLK